MDEEHLSPTPPDREAAIRRRVHRLAEFYRHLFVFVMFMAALWALNAWQIYVSVKSIKWYSWWAMWPTMGWGIGLLSHGLAVLPVWSFFSEDWEDRKVKELMERERS